MAFSSSQNRLIDTVVTSLLASRSVLMITGAGLSADSGIPTYRGSGGLYQDHSATDYAPIDEIFTAEGWRDNPSVIWQHLSRLELSCRDVKPSRGHEIIATMEREFDRFWVLTQNIDGLHQKAGSSNVITIHGNLHRLRCGSCGYQESVETYADADHPPICSHCQASMRPAVVFFGENLDKEAASLYEREITRPFDLVFSIGTSSQFAYVQDPLLDAELFERCTVEINPERTEVSGIVSIRLAMRAEDALPEIWNRYCERKA